jgi:hypothetical protein
LQRKTKSGIVKEGVDRMTEQEARELTERNINIVEDEEFGFDYIFIYDSFKDRSGFLNSMA